MTLFAPPLGGRWHSMGMLSRDASTDGSSAEDSRSPLARSSLRRFSLSRSVSDRFVMDAAGCKALSPNFIVPARPSEIGEISLPRSSSSSRAEFSVSGMKCPGLTMRSGVDATEFSPFPMVLSPIARQSSLCDTAAMSACVTRRPFRDARAQRHRTMPGGLRRASSLRTPSVSTVDLTLDASAESSCDGGAALSGITSARLSAFYQQLKQRREINLTRLSLPVEEDDASGASVGLWDGNDVRSGDDFSFNIPLSEPLSPSNPPESPPSPKEERPCAAGGSSSPTRAPMRPPVSPSTPPPTASLFRTRRRAARSAGALTELEQEVSDVFNKFEGHHVRQRSEIRAAAPAEASLPASPHSSQFPVRGFVSSAARAKPRRTRSQSFVDSRWLMPDLSHSDEDAKVQGTSCASRVLERRLSDNFHSKKPASHITSRITPASSPGESFCIHRLLAERGHSVGAASSNPVAAGTSPPARKARSQSFSFDLPVPVIAAGAGSRSPDPQLGYTEGKQRPSHRRRSQSFGAGCRSGMPPVSPRPLATTTSTLFAGVITTPPLFSSYTPPLSPRGASLPPSPRTASLGIPPLSPRPSMSGVNRRRASSEQILHQRQEKLRHRRCQSEDQRRRRTSSFSWLTESPIVAPHVAAAAAVMHRRGVSAVQLGRESGSSEDAADWTKRSKGRRETRVRFTLDL